MAPLIEPGSQGAFHADFTLSITKALGDQLAAALTDLEQAPLCEASILELREYPGVYQLYLRDEFVYVGKADKTLPGRLRQHVRKISGRENFYDGDMTFCCLYIAEDFSALAPEKLLINRYSETGQAIWNHNGFGNNDPGRRRDHTVIKANHFDRAFPADLGRVVDGLAPGDASLKLLLKQMKDGLRFTFRYAKDLGAIANMTVTLDNPEMTADQAFAFLAGHLPSEWQVVALHGYAIMYRDSPESYRSARRYYRGPLQIDADPEIAAAGEIKDMIELDEEKQ